MLARPGACQLCRSSGWGQQQQQPEKAQKAPTRPPTPHLPPTHSPVMYSRMGLQRRSGGAPSRKAILLPCFSCGEGQRAKGGAAGKQAGIELLLAVLLQAAACVVAAPPSPHPSRLPPAPTHLVEAADTETSPPKLPLTNKPPTKQAPTPRRPNRHPPGGSG